MSRIVTFDVKEICLKIDESLNVVMQSLIAELDSPHHLGDAFERFKKAASERRALNNLRDKFLQAAEDQSYE